MMNVFARCYPQVGLHDNGDNQYHIGKGYNPFLFVIME
jgi:hypothetical protein